MSDALTNQLFPGVNPGDPVAEVDPDELKAFWQKIRNLHAEHAGQSLGMTSEAIGTFCKPGADALALWYRSSMLWALRRFAQDQLAPWLKNEELSDAVFRTMATIPMEWIGHTDREGFPFDVDEFFRRLSDSCEPNS